MIDGLKPYPSYKDSGVPWLGEVPEHWQVTPLCAIARMKSITGVEDRKLLSVYLDRGVIPFSEVDEKRTNVTSEDLSKYQAVDPGDFVLNNQQAWRGSVGVSQHTGIVSPAYLVLALNPVIDPAYANFLFRERAMVDQYLIGSRGSARFSEICTGRVSGESLLFCLRSPNKALSSASSATRTDGFIATSARSRKWSSCWTKKSRP